MNPTIVRRSIAWAALAAGALGACAPQGSAPDAATDAATDAASEASVGDFAQKKLRQLLIGRFDSAAQATRNRAYFDVTLAVCPVQIASLGGAALYVEQALRGRAPYRQRLYVLGSGTDSSVEATSRVFEFLDPSAVAGLCDRAAPSELTADMVVEREGCTVTLRWQGDHFTGATSGEQCLSTLMGAQYATTELTLRERTLESWDRGFDAAGRQVWGATAGPYVFERRDALVPFE